MKLVSSPDQKSIEALIKNLLILATYSLSNLWPWGEIYTHTDTHAHTDTERAQLEELHEGVASR